MSRPLRIRDEIDHRSRGGGTTRSMPTEKLRFRPRGMSHVERQWTLRHIGRAPYRNDAKSGRS
jgi:hypothetical protein